MHELGVDDYVIFLTQSSKDQQILRLALQVTFPEILLPFFQEVPSGLCDFDLFEYFDGIKEEPSIFPLDFFIQSVVTLSQFIIFSLQIINFL